MNINEKLKTLRGEMAKAGLDAYLVTGTDSHQSEYVAPRWRTRAFISGFTGSAGTVIITKEQALLWVDSRYFIQGTAEIDGSEYKLMKLDTEGTLDPYDWVLANLKKGERIGADVDTISIDRFNALEKKFGEKEINLVGTGDLLDSFWENRPERPKSKVREVPLEYALYDRKTKLEQVREKLKATGADCIFIASIDDIAWLTNLRANDIPCNPVFMAFMFVSMDKATLFTSLSRFSDELKKKVEKDIELREYDEVDKLLPSLVKGKVYFNGERISRRFSSSVEKPDSLKGADVTTTLKARKNKRELEGMRKSHVMDAVAYINFLAKLERVPDGSETEISVSHALEKERERLEGYLGPSFNPISGFAEHGAMCHYSATKESDKTIDKDGLLVLDTGSQFFYGMTDITRTLCFGTPTAEQKKDYTLVLKGHLALAAQRFIKGTRGIQLDILAKQFMWNEGETFYHGTGHGVGFNLNVHEGPMNISAKMIDVALEEGMVISDEPGIYKEGRHGIRIENLIAVKDDVETEFGAFLSFETLTLVPYEKVLIDTSMLNEKEIKQIDAYHKRIYDTLSPLVDASSLDYLKEATSPLVI